MKVGNCSFQCINDHFWHKFQCVFNGVSGNRCHLYKIVRQLIEKENFNVSSLTSLVFISKYFENFPISSEKFSSFQNKFDLMQNFITGISRGYQQLVFDNCKQECREKGAIPFCTGYEMKVEKVYQKVYEKNVPQIENFDLNVKLSFNVKPNVPTYQEILLFPFENFVGQLGGIIGLYIGWSFFSIANFLCTKIFHFLTKRKKVKINFVNRK